MQNTSRARTLVLCVLLSSATAGCPSDSLSPSTSNVPLSPARKLAGTWKTLTAVTMNYQSDFCSDRKETVAYALWNVTWVIAAVAGSDNQVDVQMNFTRGTSAPYQSSCGNGANGWTPLVSPTFFRATVSSSAISVSDARQGIQVGGSYIESSMSVAWVRYDCVIYCSGEFTGAGKPLNLTRQ